MIVTTMFVGVVLMVPPTLNETKGGIGAVSVGHY